MAIVAVLRGVVMSRAAFYLCFVYAGNRQTEVARVKMHVEEMQGEELNEIAKELMAKAALLPPLGAVRCRRE